MRKNLKIDNRLRRATSEVKAIRHDINLAKRIFPMIENLKEKLRIEMEQEQELFPRETGAKVKTKRNEDRDR